MSNWAMCFLLFWLAWACSHGSRAPRTSTGKTFEVSALSPLLMSHLSTQGTIPRCQDLSQCRRALPKMNTGMYGLIEGITGINPPQFLATWRNELIWMERNQVSGYEPNQSLTNQLFQRQSFWSLILYTLLQIPNP